MKAIEQLEDEHEEIEIMLDILEQIVRRLDETGNLSIYQFESILDFIKMYVDKCHYTKEELLLVPALEAAGAGKDGTIYVILYEHKILKSYVRAMIRAFAAYRKGNNDSSQEIIYNAHHYIALLKEHIEKENNFFSKIAGELLSGQMQDVLSEGFDKIEEEQTGIRSHKEFHELLERLSEIYMSKK